MTLSTKAKLSLLREQLDDRGYAGYVIAKMDQHRSEYTPPHLNRMKWISNFNGTAGLVIVLKDKAAVFVDGRYTLQIQQQVDDSLFEYRSLTAADINQWLAENLGEKDRLAFDPMQLTSREVEAYSEGCKRSKAALVPVDGNLVDAIWDDRPAVLRSDVFVHPLEYAGQKFEEKLDIVAKIIQERQLDAVVLNVPSSLCWLLNIRGGDQKYTPLPSAFALMKNDGSISVFIDQDKVDDDVRKHLGNYVQLYSYESFEGHLVEIGQKCWNVGVDFLQCPAKVNLVLRENGARVIHTEDPCIFPKAIKNSVEIAGTIQAHIKDGAALSNFIAWLKRSAPEGGVTEISAAEKILEYRQKQDLFYEPSFETVSGAGPNGAIVHYRVSEETNRELQMNEVYLVDSGGQYYDGSTDVTRTVIIGTATAEQKDRFTRVLKGHIALAMARFPYGTCGMQLDILARQSLWEIGCDFAHGTGHGVGSFLNIHEGPQGISPKGTMAVLEKGMIISNEPGYYKSNEYGIRTENLVVVEEVAQKDCFEQKMLGFKTITLSPIDLDLIDLTLLTPEEKGWLNRYHQKVKETLMPLVEEETKAWLETATAMVRVAD